MTSQFSNAVSFTLLLVWPAVDDPDTDCLHRRRSPPHSSAGTTAECERKMCSRMHFFIVLAFSDVELVYENVTSS